MGDFPERKGVDIFHKFSHNQASVFRFFPGIIVFRKRAFLICISEIRVKMMQKLVEFVLDVFITKTMHFPAI